MAVRVVGTDGDQRDARSAGGEEVRVGVTAAVVRDLEDVGTQVGPLGDQPRLRLGTEITREEDRQAGHGRADDQRQVVDLGPGDRALGEGGQGEQVHVAHRSPITGHEDGPLPAEALHVAVETGGAVLGGRQRAGRHDADVPTAQRTCQAAHVIGVQMGDHDQRQPADAEPVQAPVDGSDVPADVDEHPVAGAGRQHERVPLADVAGDDHRVGGRPAADHLADRPADEEQAEERGQGQGAQPPVPPEQPADAEQQDGQQHGTGGAGRPAGGAVGDPGGTPGDGDEPPRRPAGHPHQGIRHERQGHSGDGRRQPQHGRCRHRWCGEQVGRQRDQADRPREPGDEGRGDGAGGRAHRDRVGEHRPAAPFAEPAGPARCEQDDPGGGHDGEGETRVTRQPRIQQEEHADPAAQGRDGRAGTPGRQGQEGHRAHRCGADDARARPGQHDEPDERETGDHRLDTAIDRTSAQRPQDTGQDDGDVRARHGGQVREPGAAEVVLEHRVHGAGVADDQPRQQARRSGVEHPLRGRAERLPQPAGGSLHGSRPTDERGWSPGGEHRDHVVPRPGRRDADAQSNALAREQVPPFLRRPEHHHPGPEAVDRVPVHEAGHRRIDDGPRPRLPAEHVRVPVELEHHRRDPVGDGDRAQR
jgi:hypothetical protein